MCDAKLEEIERAAAALLTAGERPRTSGLVPLLEARGYCRLHVRNALDESYRANRLRVEVVPPGASPTLTPEALWSLPSQPSAEELGKRILHYLQSSIAKQNSHYPPAENRQIPLIRDEYPAEYPDPRKEGAQEE